MLDIEVPDKQQWVSCFFKKFAIRFNKLFSELAAWIWSVLIADKAI